MSRCSIRRFARPAAARGLLLCLGLLFSGEWADALPAADGWRFEDASDRLTGPSPDPNGGPRHDYGPIWGDFDGDGRLDLVFLNHGDFPSIYLNRNGGLEDAFDRSGLQKDGWTYPQQRDRHGGACADFDNDGDTDLVITHGALRGETLGVKSDELLVNQGDGTFTDRALEAGARNEQGRARTPVWIDYDLDGWMDLLIGNFISNNVLLRNRGDGTFSDVSTALGLAGRSGAHPSWSDVDDDGDPDLLTLWPVEMKLNNGDGGFTVVPRSRKPGYPWVPGPVATAWGDFDDDGDADVYIASRQARLSTLFANDGGRFHRVPLALGLEEDEAGAGAAWGDLDNDGDLDLVALGSTQVRLLENLGDGRFHSTALSAPGLRPGVDGDVDLGDFDHDGRLDIALNAEDGQHLFRNLQDSGEWLVLELQGTASNAQGIGARVSVRSADGAAIFRQHRGDTGFHRSVSCAPLSVGLGESETAEIEVRWPSGRRSLLESIPTGRRIVLVEPDR